MCDSTKPFKGFPLCSFYGTKKLNNLHILKTRRKLKLDKLENFTKGGISQHKNTVQYPSETILTLTF